MIEILILGSVLLSCFFALILLVWFKTEAIVEYASLFGLKKLFKANEFRVEKMSLEQLTYPTFLKMKSNNFFIKLITCPICLSVWMTIIFECVMVMWAISLGKAYILLLWTLYLLFIAAGPAICILTLLIYGLVVVLLKLK
jgi:hypothetical protein